MKKNPAYYMKLEYKSEIIQIPKNRGGGFEASIPQLGSYAFVGQGETKEEALKDLEETKKENFEEYIEKGIEIPEPEEAEREFRGDFLLRMPLYLHRALYYAAKENEVSLNQHMNYLLTKIMTLDSLEKKIKEMSEKVDGLSKKISGTSETAIVLMSGTALQNDAGMVSWLTMYKDPRESELTELSYLREA